jgi:hypothetical protein
MRLNSGLFTLLLPVSVVLAVVSGLGGCTSPTPDDTSAADADADTDTDADTDADSDSDTDPPDESSITGTVVAWDGPVGAGVEVQACVTRCFSTETDASGNFSFTGLGAGDYKLDVVGEGVDGKDYGRIRVQAIVEQSAAWAAPSSLFLPKMSGPTSITQSGTYTFGAVEWMVDPAILTVPIGYDAGMYSVGVVGASDIGLFWPVTPVIAVAFGPLGTEVVGTFDVTVTDPTVPAGSYDVYAVDYHGDLEGVVGKGISDGATVHASVTPAHLTWLLFVPQV